MKTFFFMFFEHVIKDQITLKVRSINITGGTFVHNVERKFYGNSLLVVIAIVIP